MPSSEGREDQSLSFLYDSFSKVKYLYVKANYRVFPKFYRSPFLGGRKEVDISHVDATSQQSLLDSPLLMSELHFDHFKIQSKVKV